MDILQKHVFKGLEKGKHILFLGAVHGNETCGPKAIEKVLAVLKKKPDLIQNGTACFIPVCNPKAYNENKRYIEVNLNRVIKRTSEISLYEEGLADQIAQAIEMSDIVLDIHSATAPTTPFVFQMQQGKKMDEFSAALGLSCVLSGDDFVSEGLSTTLHYAAQSGKQGLLIESGSHNDDASAVVAEKVIWNALAYAEVLADSRKPDIVPDFFSLNGYVTYEKKGTLSRNWRGFERVSKDELLGTYDDGEEVRAPRDCYLVLPTHNPPLGEQWFFFADKRTENKYEQS